MTGEAPDGAPERGEAILIAAFEGWSDTAEAASGAVDHLIGEWDAETVLELDTEEYYDYQVLRPVITIADGVVDGLRWRGSSLLRARAGNPRAYLLGGAEPSFRWKAYCGEVLELAQAHDVGRAVLFGAFPAAAAHTRPLPVVGCASDPGTARALGLESTEYEGMTSIAGALAAALPAGGVSTVSMWAAVPYYTADLPCPKATLALLRRLEDALDIPVPYGDLPERAREWELEVAGQVREDDDLVAYVQRLEAQAPLADMREASGDEIAREFERYLRRQGRSDGGRGESGRGDGPR